MRPLLIAAGVAAMLLGAAPAVAAPMPLAPAMSAPQDGRWAGRDNRRFRDDARADRKVWMRKVRRNQERRRWSYDRRCHNVRRHHRWVRVCR